MTRPDRLCCASCKFVMMNQPFNSLTPAREPHAPDAERSTSRLRLLIVVLIVLMIVRLVGLHFSVVDLFYDESQYWSWAQDPALGYFSKPPLLAWLLTGVHHACGDSEWCTRAPGPVIYTATAFVVYSIGRQLYGEQTGFWAGLLTAFTPGIVFSSRIISTDIPLLFFWSVALLAYVKILLQPHKGWGIVLGLAMGLGLLSKYAMIYFVPGMLLAALLSARARGVLRHPAIWLALPIAVIVVLPNVAWNVANSFATFRHTGGLVAGEPFRPSLLRALEFLASQFAVAGPVIFAIMLALIVRPKSRSLLEQDRLMAAFFIPPIVAVAAFAVYSRAYANWASPAVVSGIIAGAAILLRLDRRNWLWGSVALGVAIQLVLLASDAVATRLPGRIAGLQNPYNRTLGWRRYAEATGELATRIGARYIASDDRRAFNTLRYYWRGKRETVVSWHAGDEPPYDFAHPLSDSTSEPILFVTRCPNAHRLREFYGNVEPLGVVPDMSESRAQHSFAFRLEQRRSAIRELGPCVAEQG